MSMAISFGRKGIYGVEFPSIKSPDPLIMWSWKVTKIKILAAVPLLTLGLWILNLARRWITIRNFDSLSHISLWTCGHVRWCDKLKIFYFHYHSAYDYQYLSHMTLWWCGVVILISLIRFIDFPRKFLSRHQILGVSLIIVCTFSYRTRFESLGKTLSYLIYFLISLSIKNYLIYLFITSSQTGLYKNHSFS